MQKAERYLPILLAAVVPGLTIFGNRMLELAEINAAGIILSYIGSALSILIVWYVNEWVVHSEHRLIKKTGRRAAILLVNAMLSILVLSLNYLENKNTSFEGQFNIVPVPILMLRFFVMILMVNVLIRIFKGQKEREALKEDLVKAQSDNVLKLEMEVRKRTEEIEAQASKLEDLNHQKDKLLAIISHDIRNPLSSLKSITQLLDPKILSEHQLAEIKTNMINQLNGLSDSIVNLLDWAKAQLEGQGIQFEDFDLATITEEIMQFYDHASTEKGVSIENRVSKRTMVYADINQIRTILRNLVGNGVKFTERRDVISMLARKEGDTVTVEVRDTGVGMSAEVVAGLFTLGGASKTGTKGESGTGLGLSLVDDFVQNHGGKLWVESQEGKGSSFFFTLPSRN